MLTDIDRIDNKTAWIMDAEKYLCLVINFNFILNSIFNNTYKLIIIMIMINQ